MKEKKETAETLILNSLKTKSKLKQKIFNNTFETFKLLKEVLQEISDNYSEKLKDDFKKDFISFNNISDFQAELKIAGDILIFKMHSNIFEFDRNHGVRKISYVQNNKMSTFSGIINIYNFLADSFKYDRVEDLGYLIGRIFVNKEKHYFVEGKRQIGYLYSNFGNDVISKESLKNIVETSISYILGFDLLVPVYDDVMIINVEQIHESRTKRIKTGKRLGFGFRADDVKGDALLYTGG